MASGHQRILAHHLVLSGYGFWLANDPRGSGSTEIRQERFEELGPIHPGRKRIQPSRAELREFHRKAAKQLDHTPIWFDKERREEIGKAFCDVIARRKYTAWACSIGTNHAHLCVRMHRDRYQEMFEHLTAQVRTTFIEIGMAEPAHPIWADRPYSVFLHTREDIERVIEYIERNPEKEGLPKQEWDFVQNYDGWPFK